VTELDKAFCRLKDRILCLLFIVLTASPLIAQSTKDRSEGGGPTPVAGGGDFVPAPADRPLLERDWTGEAKKHLPAWLSFGGQYRGRVESQIGRQFQPGDNDLYYLSRLRLNLDIQAGSHLRFSFQGQDAHSPGLKTHPHPPAYTDSFDLRQAYVELRGTGSGKSLGLKIGRQELVFGEERLLGALDWGNTARSFDAVRGYFSTPKVRVDVFAASVVPIRDGAFDNFQSNGNGLYGVYGSLKKLIPRSTFEPYFLYKTIHRVRSERGTLGAAGIYTYGARMAGQLPHSFDYGVEAAGQAGTIASDSLRAWAGHGLLGYTIGTLKTTPRLAAEYNYASGDKSSLDGKRGAFDQLFPTNHNKYGTADQLGWRNMRSVRAGVELKLRPRLLVSSGYLSHWLAQGSDAFYGANGAVVARIASGASSRHVGQELDLVLLCAVSKRYTFGLGYAHLWAGKFLRQATAGGDFSYPYSFVTYNF